MRPGVFIPPLLLVQAVWLLAPGLLVGVTLLRRGTIAAHYVVPVAALVGAVFSYTAFWVYFGNRATGWAYSAATAVISLAALVILLVRPDNRRSLRALDVAGPLVLLYLVTVFYSSVTFACSVTPTVSEQNQLCHINGLTGDNILPRIFADNIYNGTPKAITWTFQGSDRPPLQAGAVLMQTPLTQLGGWKITSYQLLATLMQVLWLPALWALCRSLRLSNARLAVVTTLCVFSGFFLFNSVFTWPKLLAAALVLLAFGLLFFERLTYARATLAGVAIAMAMMAHPGVLFTLLPMTVALVVPRLRQSWRSLVIVGAITLIIMAPWQAYQSLYDPPGNRLLKWHLAGVVDVDGRTVGQAVRDAYTKTPPATIVHNKLTNVGTVFGLQRRQFRLDGTGKTAVLRDEEFRYVLFSLGPFNLGWLALCLPGVRARVRRLMDASRLRLILALAGAATLLWALIIFIPGEAVTFQGSYATMMLLIAACGAVITVFPRNVIRVLLAVQVGYFAVVWVLTVWRPHHLHWSYVALSVAGAAGVLALLGSHRRWVWPGSGAAAAEPPSGVAGAVPAAHAEASR